MGRCKICGTGIEDAQEMCDDCKALDDVDLIKSDDELEELLNSVMHSHTSYPKNDEGNFTSSVEMTIDPINEIDKQKEADDISFQLDSITNDLLEQYGLDDGLDEALSMDKAFSVTDMKSDYNLNEKEPYLIDGVSTEEEEPFSVDALAINKEEPFSDDTLVSEKEEPFSVDTLVAEEEEPLSIDTLVGEEEEPFSIDTLVGEEEEPLSIDTLVGEEEEPFSVDTLVGEEEEPFSIDTLVDEEEEPFSLDSFMEEEDSFTTNKDMDNAISQSEQMQVDNDLYAEIPEFKGIFDGIDDSTEVSDVSDIFSDVLGTVSNYGTDDEENGANKSLNKEKTSSKEKKNFFKNLFANIKNEETEKEFLKEKELEEEKSVQKAAAKEQKKADAAAKKAKKAENKKIKLATKAAKKAEKTNHIAEEEHDNSKINKKGATVVLTAFGMLCAIIVLGTNTFSYSASIKQAEDYFARRKYTKAYSEISGVDVKKEDQELANKIKTVMYVNKEYDSYSNYYAIQYYAEALNSLLNGLTKYDVYLDQASELGVKSDLQYVKSQILEELEEKFNLDEESAKKITSIDDQEKYSDKVFALAKKLVTDKKK